MTRMTDAQRALAHAFPKDFIWGSATASYQVEGFVDEDSKAEGRATSIWDTYAHVPGNIADGSDGSRACEQYTRYPEDIALMKELGLDAYRMSIAWPRIFTSLEDMRAGRVNRKALDHYTRMLDALREADIKPIVTLYHWDLPQYLQDEVGPYGGGWANRETALRFGDYAAALAKGFGDRVETWTTLNEPWCAAYLGYAQGRHAPGIRDDAQALAAVHHLNLAHGLGVSAVKAELGEKAQTSVTLNLQVNRAATDSPDDRAAKAQADRIANEVWLGPMLDGVYDPQIFEDARGVTDWSFIQPGDLEQIHQPLNSLGINYYCTQTVRRAPAQVHPQNAREDPIVGGTNIDILPPEGPLTAMGWNQEPEGLRDIVLEMSARYPELDIMITENGSAWEDELVPDDADGGALTVHDPDRVHYLSEHLRALNEAREQGARVTGYFAWSLMDNYEWALGYSRRFGIVYVDYPTQRRIWKDTARWYREFIRERRAA
ncbi:GH1 family beta-glucosidase [Alloscardovia macacae]|uniref:GH1 family beta-glucosidase n=1 Tax=Alloscardovia macacae TaxID=1160091 RepID=UPI00214D50F2|nr:GH1 family beta-glucosidase [Alloscardovia macacae]